MAAVAADGTERVPAAGSVSECSCDGQTSSDGRRESLPKKTDR